MLIFKTYYLICFRRVERGHGGVHKQSKSPEKEVNHTPPPLEKEICSWTLIMNRNTSY